MKMNKIKEIEKITDVVYYLNGLKALIFDLDDTLYSEKEYVRSGFKKVGEFLSDIPDVEKKLWKYFENGKSAIDELLMHEGIYTETLKEECLKLYRFQSPSIHLYPGVAQMLLNLNKSGYLLGIITDGRPEGQKAKVDALRIRAYMNKIVITDELGGVKARKPNPAAFYFIQKELGISYQEMCYIGDNIKKDFIAPEQLGMQCIWFRNPDGLYYDNSIILEER